MAPEPVDALTRTEMDAGVRREVRPLAAALRAYAEGRTDAVIDVLSDLGEAPSLAVSVLFCSESEMSELDRCALDLCAGRVLDLGAAAGRHTLVLQERGLAVTAIDVLREAVEIMRARGVADARLQDIFTFEPDAPFDTVLALMNGTTLAGSLAGLDALLVKLTSVVAPRGQVLIDSTDLGGPEDEAGRREDGRYCGEVQYQLGFEGIRGPPIPQLFVDPETLGACAEQAGWACEVVARGDGGAYLARLERD